jgi:hypothetical protein
MAQRRWRVRLGAAAEVDLRTFYGSVSTSPNGQLSEQRCSGSPGIRTSAPERLRLRLFLGTVVLARKGRFALCPCVLRASLPRDACDGGSGDQTNDAEASTSGSQKHKASGRALACRADTASASGMSACEPLRSRKLTWPSLISRSPTIAITGTAISCAATMRRERVSAPS